jgi:hypothetical protein
MSSRTPNRTRKIIIRVIALVLALLICGVLYDLYFPCTTHLREFDITALGFHRRCLPQADSNPQRRSLVAHVDPQLPKGSCCPMNLATYS